MTISDSQRENTRVVLRQLFALWDKRSHLYGKVFFASAVTRRRQDNKWRNVVSVLFPMHRSEIRSVDLKADYGDFKLVDGAMTIDDAKSVLTNVVDRDKLSLPGMPDIELEASLHPNSPSHLWDSSWQRYPLHYPYHEFTFSIDQEYKGESPQDALYSIDQPLFPSGAPAIQSFLGMRLGDNSSYSGILAALAPDYRGKIEEIRIGTNSVKVEIECLEGSSEKDLLGKFNCHYYAGVSVTADLTFNSHTAVTPISDFPRDLHVVLLSRTDGELVDRRHFLAGSRNIVEDVTIEMPEQNYEQTIQLGESDNVEFKREIPSRREDIAIAVTGLANRRGGTLFIGVADNAEILGWKRDKGKDDITQILKSHCDPLPAFTIEEVQIRNLPITIVTVPEGKDKPYNVKEKGVFIRTQGTTRIASRYELDEMYLAKSNGPISLFRGE